VQGFICKDYSRIKYLEMELVSYQMKIMLFGIERTASQNLCNTAVLPFLHSFWIACTLAEVVIENLMATDTYRVQENPLANGTRSF
jgi:hypothetical protein